MATSREASSKTTFLYLHDEPHFQSAIRQIKKGREINRVIVRNAVTNASEAVHLLSRSRTIGRKLAAKHHNAIRRLEKEVTRLRHELLLVNKQLRSDPLTGALSRKGLDEAFEQEAARAKLHGVKLCVAFLDIDNFKKINDSFGHVVGDQALVHLAKVIRENTRAQDYVARYGGDEFVILLPDATVDSAVTAIDRLQRSLANCIFLHKNDKVNISFTCGVVELGEQETLDAAIARADAAMYIAKRAGKKRAVPA